MLGLIPLTLQPDGKKNPALPFFAVLCRAEARKKPFIRPASQ
jgi:hypothetical protein